MHLMHPGLLTGLIGLIALGSMFLFGTSSVPNASPTIISASGSIPAAGGVFHITKAGVAAIVFGLPTVDGLRPLFVDDGGHAHTIVFASPPSGLNAAAGTLTFNGTSGSSVELVSSGGRWYTAVLNGVTVS